MVKDQRARRPKFGIVEALLIRTEVYTGVPRRGQHIWKLTSRLHIEQVDRLLIGSAFTNVVHQQTSVLGNVGDVDGRVLIGAELGGIDELFVAAFEALTD